MYFHFSGRRYASWDLLQHRCCWGTSRLYARHMYNAKTFFYAKVQDQIDVTKQLVDLYPFIDKSRVGSTLVCLFCTLPTYIFTRLPFGAGVTVVSWRLQSSLQMLTRATSLRFLFFCWIKTIKDFLLVRHQRCPSHQLDLLRFHLHWEVVFLTFFGSNMSNAHY